MIFFYTVDKLRRLDRITTRGKKMTNNDVLKRLRYVFDYSTSKMIEISNLAELNTKKDCMEAWLLQEDEEGYEECTDRDLAVFLNGLIIEKRGKKDGPQLVPEKRLTNNSIFMKLRIALNFTAEDVLAVMALADYTLSPHELSSFFRKPGNRHYKECQDQILRKFLKGVQLKFRPNE